MQSRHDFPILIMSFDRHHYLRQVLESLLMQQGAALQGRSVALFQDGGRDGTQDMAHTSAENILACVTTFREFFPEGAVHLSDINLGPALNFERAERFAFETLAADAAIFLEDDLVLAPRYIDMVDRLLTANMSNPHVGYVAAYGDHRLSAEAQRAAAGQLIFMRHNWGFGLTKRQWLAMRPHVQQYLDLVRHDNYRRRDHAAIRALYESWGFGVTSTSQDTAKSLACCLTRAIKISTTACFATYIGERGLHMEPGLFAREGFARTVMFDGPPPEVPPVDDSVFHAIRAEMLTWAGKPKPRAQATLYSDALEKRFRQVNTLCAARTQDEAEALATETITELFQSGTARAVGVRFAPRASIEMAARNSTIRIDAAPGRLDIACPREMVTANFTDFYNPFVLAADIVTTAAAGVPEARAAFTMELGACTLVPRERCVAFSAPVPHKPVVMDYEFYATDGHARLREAVKRGWIPWRARRDVVFWRGNTAGIRGKLRMLDGGQIAGWDWLQRLHFCARAAESAYADKMDVGITRIIQVPEAPVRAAIETSGFMRAPVAQIDWMLYRYVCVMDGNASAGSGLFAAMLTGACVLLVQSPAGLRNWLGDALVDWQTHVPVAADLSDLEERLAWIFANPEACEKIAARAFEFACRRRFDTEKAGAVREVLALL